MSSSTPRRCRHRPRPRPPADLRPSRSPGFEAWRGPAAIALRAAYAIIAGRAAVLAARDFLDFWEPEGRQHFRVEEEVPLPGWALRSPVDRTAVARMLEQHLEIRRRATGVAAGEASIEGLKELGALLDDQVRLEQREIFPMIEAVLEPEDLDRLAIAIEAAEAGQ